MNKNVTPPVSKKFRIISENEHIDMIRNALRKMGIFLSERGIAISAKEVKQKSRIEVKGVADNGKERLLQPEILETYGIDTLEESEGYNTVFPPFKDGVIMCKTEELGTYYTHFIVRGETEDEFDLEIHEYRFYNQVFFLHHLALVEGVNKTIPMGETQTRYSGIKGFFLNHFDRQELKDFSDDDLWAIQSVALADDEKREVDAITSYTFSTFRVVNFLKEYYQQKEANKSTFFDNEYFVIKNWNSEVEADIIPDDIGEQLDEWIENIVHKEMGFEIVGTHTIGEVIPKIIEKANIKKFCMAVGFAFRSGLGFLETSLQIIKERNGECELVLGSLQNYNDERANNKIDRNTVSYLNGLLNDKFIRLYTYKNSFYHGKFYYMSNEKKSFVIMGSSNISKTAFKVNYEMDIIHIMDKGSEQEKQFLNWYNQLREECEKIETLNERNFEEYNWTCELDAFHSLKNRRVSNEEMRQKIDAISDEELKYRLTLWMNKNPTDRYEDLEIDALKDYVMFVYANSGLVVFESFIPGNAYYVFRYRKSLMNLLDDISSMSKTQMACSIHYVNRGYHVQSKETLAKRIDRYFKM